MSSSCFSSSHCLCLTSSHPWQQEALKWILTVKQTAWSLFNPLGSQRTHLKKKHRPINKNYFYKEKHFQHVGSSRVNTTVQSINKNWLLVWLLHIIKQDISNVTYPRCENSCVVPAAREQNPEWWRSCDRKWIWISKLINKTATREKQVRTDTCQHYEAV